MNANNVDEYMSIGTFAKNVVANSRVLLTFFVLGALVSVIFYLVTQKDQYLINENFPFKKVNQERSSLKNFVTDKSNILNDFVFFVKNEKIVNTGLKKFKILDSRKTYDVIVKEDKALNEVEVKIYFHFYGDENMNNSKEFIKWIANYASTKSMQNYLEGKNEELLSLEKNLNDQLGKVDKVKEYLENPEISEKLNVEFSDNFKEMLNAFAASNSILQATHKLNLLEEKIDNLNRLMQVLREEIDFYSNPENVNSYFKITSDQKPITNKVISYKESVIIFLFIFSLGVLVVFYKIFFKKN